MPKTTLDPRVCIIGAGIVGLTCALQCAELGIPVALVEAKPPSTQGPIPLSARVSALNTTSINELIRLGVWSQLDATHRGVFRSLLIWDSLTGTEMNFDSADMALPSLGYNVSNAALVRALWLKAQATPAIRLIAPMTVSRLITTEGHSKTVVLDNGELLEPDLVIGADGAKSWVRQAMKVDANPTPYDHHALVSVVSTEKPHAEQGWQVFLPTGPLALLPLSDPHQCAVVWSLPPDQAKKTASLSDTQFKQAINEAFGLRLGCLQPKLPVRAIPLTRQHASTYTKPGVALIGDAAHTIHPLAGQGANLGLRDATALTRHLQKAYRHNRHLGHPSLLARYERSRRADNQLMQQAMGLLQYGFGNDQAAWVQIRKLAMRSLNKLPPTRRLILRYAAGLLTSA